MLPTKEHCVNWDLDSYQIKRGSRWPVSSPPSGRGAEPTQKDAPNRLSTLQNAPYRRPTCYKHESQDQKMLFRLPGTPIAGKCLQQILEEGNTAPIPSSVPDDKSSHQAHTGRDEESNGCSSSQPQGKLVAHNARPSRRKTPAHTAAIKEHVRSQRKASIQKGTQFMELVRSVFISINSPKTFSLKMALEFSQHKWKNPHHGAKSWERFAKFHQENKGSMEASRDESLLDIKALLARHIPDLRNIHTRCEGAQAAVSQISTAIEACFQIRLMQDPLIQHQLLKMKKTMMTSPEAQKLQPPDPAMDLDKIFKHLQEAKLRLRDRTVTLHMLDTGARRSDLAGCRRHETTMQLSAGRFGQQVAKIMPCETKGAALAKRLVHNVHEVHEFPWNKDICFYYNAMHHLDSTLEEDTLIDKTFLTVDKETQTQEVTTGALCCSLSRNSKCKLLTPLSSDRIGNCISKVIKDAGCHVPSKELRKSVSSLLKIAANLSDEEVCNHLGWTDMKTWKKNCRRDMPIEVFKRHQRKMHPDIPIGWRIKRSFIPEEHKAHMHEDSHDPDAIRNIVQDLKSQETDNQDGEDSKESASEEEEEEKD